LDKSRPNFHCWSKPKMSPKIWEKSLLSKSVPEQSFLKRLLRFKKTWARQQTWSRP
jgi:hypothetical protein